MTTQTIFPTGMTHLTPSVSVSLFSDDGTQGGYLLVSDILGLLALPNAALGNLVGTTGTAGALGVVAVASPLVVSGGTLSISGTLGFSGGLTVGANTGATLLSINGATSQNRQIEWFTAGSPRWILQTNSDAESGSNAGSNFALQSFTDTGATLLAPVLKIIRSSGAATFYGALAANAGLSVTGGATIAGTTALTGTATALTQASGDNSTNIATTAFVSVATAGAASISTTGGSTTLTNSQLGKPVWLVTGALVSNATLVVSNNGRWTVCNRTTGAFTLTVKTSAGTGVNVVQGLSLNIIADGTNVVAANTDTTYMTTLPAAATGVTQATGDNSTKLATTAFVRTANSGVASIATSGGTTTLTAAQYGVPTIIATGALVGNAIFVVPNTGDWLVLNRTSGSFTLTVKTAAGTGVNVAQGYGLEVVSDGTNTVISGTDLTGVTLQGAVTNSGTISGGTVVANIGLNTATITATGTTQGTAAVASTQRVIITAGAAGTSVKIPATVGQATEVWNRSGSDKLLWPVTGARFETFGTNASASIADGSKVTVLYTTTTQGYIG